MLTQYGNGVVNYVGKDRCTVLLSAVKHKNYRGTWFLFIECIPVKWLGLNNARQTRTDSMEG